MAKLVWDDVGEHLYETGVDHGVLYTLDDDKAYKNAEVWDGLTSISASPSGAEETKLWADNINYASLRSMESYGGTIEAYTYPDTFAECDGTAELVTGAYIGQQPRAVFGLAYRTIVGNEVDLNDHGYKIHLIWGASCSPSQKQYSTVNDSPEAITFSWEFTTTPVPVTGYKPTSEMIIDSNECDDEALAALEAQLFGVDAVEADLANNVDAVEEVDPWLPTPDVVIAILNGTWEPEGT